MSCSLTATVDQPARSSAEAHKSALAMVSVVAPEAMERERLPLELSAVVDRSGSMSGDKMELVKATLELLVRKAGLKAEDKLSIVSFDNEVREELPLTAMGKDGRQQAEDAVRGLRVGGMTNLSGGMLKGIDTLCSSRSSGPATRSSGPANTTRALLLFTDGHANHGIEDTHGLVAAAQGAMAGAPLTVFTFGFGADHNEDMLRAVADATNGLYYYIQRTDDIPTAFADCLGGLVSVVAQNAVLTLQTDPRAAGLEKVHGSYKVAAAGEAGVTTVDLGDLYAEDEKDVLLELSLPALNEPHPGPLPALRASLRYFSVASSRVEEVLAELSIARPAETPEGQPVNLKLDEQKNRMQVAEAMAAAARLADAGNLEQGRELLRQATIGVMASPSVALPISSALIGDCARLQIEYEDEVRYRSVGSKMSKMSAMSHFQQRSNHTSAEVYSKKGKGGMKSMFCSAMS